MGKALKSIRCQQRKWAGEENISPKGYRRKLKDNLFQNLDNRTRRDFERADGNELYGKMNAVHSSSALACNFFDYWRVREMDSLAHAMDIKENIDSIGFEKPFRTGLRRTPPHLDVVFCLSDQTIFAIESKFTEPYDKSKRKNDFAESYFPSGKKLWKEKELVLCQGVAEKMHKSQLRYQHLDAAQLLKHMLGLANSKGTGEPMCYKNWTFLYLWFNPGGPEAECHEKEIKQFISEVSRGGKVGGGGKIRVMTYQNLFKRLPKKLGDSHKEYQAYKYYLDQRYSLGK